MPRRVLLQVLGDIGHGLVFGLILWVVYGVGCGVGRPVRGGGESADRPRSYDDEVRDREALISRNQHGGTDD